MLSPFKLKRNFFDASSIECDRSSPFLKPAIAFEVRNSLTGIAGDYIFPDNKTATGFESSLRYSSAIRSCFRPPHECNFNIEQIAKPELCKLREMQADWDDLRWLNPELDAVEVTLSESFNMLQAINGVACLLNVSDIAFYVQKTKETNSYAVFANMRKDPEWNRKYDEVVSISQDRYVGWVPSHSTLEDAKIEFAIRGLF